MLDKKKNIVENGLRKKVSTTRFSFRNCSPEMLKTKTLAIF